MNFEKILIAAIDESFCSLGEGCKQAIFFHLEQDYMLNRENIPNRIEDFSNAIDCIFGIGAKVLQCIIIRNLFKRMKRPIPFFDTQKPFNFTNYLKSAKIASNLSFFEIKENASVKILLPLNH
jgi:hypothetical protein